MRKLINLLLRKARKRISFDPWPSADIRNTVLPLALASQIVPRNAGELAAEMDLQHAVDSQSLVVEALDGIGNFLLSELGEVVGLALVGCSLGKGGQ
jgi:hypothetical protein